ncbi:MAG: hypothetical protein R3B36_04490 [Polyangiaceae bacterium]
MSLESSVTLEDVFTVVEAKRVPLAPELAGYLTLEIADGTDAAGGAVDPKVVYVSEEGSVALVRPKREGAQGDAEASVRAILAKLLEGSGSSTPALSAAAKRKAGQGLKSLSSELESALIPVNRAAGRRALARLAREVRRVTLGLGRNASVPPTASPQRPGSRPDRPASQPDRPASQPDRPASRVASEPEIREAPRPAMQSFDDEAVTARRPNLAPDGEAADKAEKKPEPKPEKKAEAPSGPAKVADSAPPGGPLPLPPVVKPTAPLAPPPKREDKLFKGNEVEDLLQTFEVSKLHPEGDKGMTDDLKAIAGLDPTPPPPDARTLAELTKDVGRDLPKKLEGDSVEDLLAFADASAPVPPAAVGTAADAKRVDSDQMPTLGLGEISALVPSEGDKPLDLGPLFPEASAPVTAEPPASPPPIASPQTVALPEAPAKAVEPAIAVAVPKSKPPVSPRPAAPPPQPAPAPRAAPAPAPAPVAAAPAPAKKRGASTGRQEPRAPRTSMLLLVLALLSLGLGAIAIWKLKPGFFTGRTPEKIAQEKAEAEAARLAALQAAQTPKCKLSLVVTEVPSNAEVLLRVGQAPVDVERMPVGARLEFVATAEGYAPRRLVVKAEAAWDKGPDGKPRLEVPIQLDPSKAKPGAIDPWPPAEPGSAVGGANATAGTVHVVSNVRGADLWLLAGLGPEARIEGLKCEGEIDVLLAGGPTLRKRLHVADKEISAATPDAKGNRVVTIAAGK